MKTKMAQLVVSMSFKADAAPGARTFEGLASTWEQDLGNDVIHKGAFKDAIKEWKATGSDAIPLLNSHDHYDIFSAIGQLVDMKETNEGLWTKWEVIDGAEGDGVLARLRPSKTTGKPIVGKMSIGYEPLEYSFEQPEGSDSYWDRIRHLTKVALKEVSLVLFPMNPGAAIDPSTVKTFMAMTQDTDPRKLSVQTKTELRKLASRIGLLLKQDKAPDPKCEDPSDEQDPPKPPTPPKKKSDPAPSGTDDLEDTDDVDEADDADDEQDPPTGDDPSGDIPPEEVPQEKTYVYSEALAQRLQSVMLKTKVSDITNTNK